MMNGLRLRSGIPRQFWIERCGLPPEVLMPAVEKLIQQGLMAADADYYRTTDLGYRFLNTVLQQFE